MLAPVEDKQRTHCAPTPQTQELRLQSASE
jgi:hypothetical protein